jgi:hypothetical protein
VVLTNNSQTRNPVAATTVRRWCVVFMQTVLPVLQLLFLSAEKERNLRGDL